MRDVRYLTPSIVRDYVDRQKKMADFERTPYDPNIAKGDFAVNVFALVLLLGWIVYLLME